MVLCNFRLAAIFTCPGQENKRGNKKRKKNVPVSQACSPQSDGYESMGTIPSSHGSEALRGGVLILCVVLLWMPVGVAVLLCADRLRASFNFRPWLGFVAGRYLAVRAVRYVLHSLFYTPHRNPGPHPSPERAPVLCTYCALQSVYVHTGVPASQPPSPANPQLSSPTSLLQPEHAAHAACIASTKDASGQWSAEVGGFVSHPPSHQPASLPACQAPRPVRRGMSVSISTAPRRRAGQGQSRADWCG